VRVSDRLSIMDLRRVAADASGHLERSSTLELVSDGPCRCHFGVGDLGHPLVVVPAQTTVAKTKARSSTTERGQCA